MLGSFIDRLRCPFCEVGTVTLRTEDSLGPQAGAGDRIDDGVLSCRSCQRTTQIVDRVWHAMGDHRWEKTPAQISNVVPPTPQLYERLWRVRSLSLLSGRSFPIDEELAELSGAVHPGPGKIFVDVACSEGLYARSLADAGAVVFAVDHSRPFLQRLVHRAGHRPIIAIRALAQHLPLATATLDGAVLGGSLNEIGDQRACLGEMARVTRPGGYSFSMSLTTATTARGRLLQRLLKPTGIVVPTVDETIALHEQAGLSVTGERLDRIVLRVTAQQPAPAL